MGKQLQGFQWRTLEEVMRTGEEYKKVHSIQTQPQQAHMSEMTSGEVLVGNSTNVGLPEVSGAKKKRRNATEADLGGRKAPARSKGKPHRQS